MMICLKIGIQLMVLRNTAHDIVNRNVGMVVTTAQGCVFMVNIPELGWLEQRLDDFVRAVLRGKEESSLSHRVGMVDVGIGHL